MEYIKQHICELFFVCLFVSCGGSDDVEPPTPEPVPSPVAATLVFPENNTECNEGEIISDTESRVVFRWNVSENADSYTINLKNLNSDNVQNLNVDQNELAITILRGTPYEWSVTSKASGTSDIAQSDTWRFYNAGVAIESHSPFPASVINPAMGSQVSAGNVTLSWESIDLNNDIVAHEVFMDTSNPPVSSLGTVTGSSLQTTVTSGNIYYWKVITEDSEGNKSNSSIFQFRVE